MRSRPSPEQIAVARREIAKRYSHKAKLKSPKRSRSLAAWRVAELTRLFDHRYGKVLLPATEEGELCARVMVHHLGGLQDAASRIRSWFQTCTPWLGLASRERLIRDATERRIHWKADKLAWKLKVTAAEREALNLRTIGAIDQSREQRASIQAERKRQRERERRRSHGARAQAEYLANSISRAKPWELVGISRAEWYRRRRKAEMRQVRAMYILSEDI